jgi:glutamate synthase domain-containing protein 2
MSFGALSANAILALNKGAKLGNFAHNTGEGGISSYHREGGGDLIWQIGTGYFGCRTESGEFDTELFTQQAASVQVKMIEIKLSQGAKPAHGGVLPAAKISPEIADIRGIAMNKDCISPPTHSSFDSPTGLLTFVDHLRNLSGGKPVGFKLCIGIKSEFMGICKAMLETGITPDFITVDGAEGGTGAAPVEFTNRLGMTCLEATYFVHNCLIGAGLRDQIKLIASGKTASGFELLSKLALGADMVNAARSMMLALGCIQSRACNTNQCPTGVATQDPTRNKALNVERKYIRVKNYQQATVHSCMELIGAMGLDNPGDLQARDILIRAADETNKPYNDIYTPLNVQELLTDAINPEYAADWAKASSAHF